MLATAPVMAEGLHLSGSASISETYSSNVDYTAHGDGGFVTSIYGALNLSGETGGKRLRLTGSIGGGQQLVIGRTQNNAFVPNVNLAARLEAIENFAYVDAQARITPSFLSPFGARSADTVNATQNRYTQQSYSLSPYIKGHFPSTNISYQLRDDNFWSIASSFGDNSPGVPSTYASTLSGSVSYPAQPLGWTVDYSRSYYDNGAQNVANVGQGGTYTTQTLRLTVPYQFDPQLQFSGRLGAESNQYPFTNPRNVIYGVGGQWNPSDRTSAGGFWEHRFFGGAYSAHLSHRLPNVSLSANFSRDLTSYPQLALSIPAGAEVGQYLDAALTTRVPDPAARAIAVNQFLATTGLPTTLGTPVNYYAASTTLQRSASISAVVIGAHNSISFSVFDVHSEAISDPGAILPATLQFAQNNTQLGGSVAYSHVLFAQANLGLSATYSRATSNASDNQRSKNGSVAMNIGTQVGPKTSANARVSYSRSEIFGSLNPGTISALNFMVSLSHTFF